jgi:nucleoid DNA-binding protein
MTYSELVKEIAKQSGIKGSDVETVLGTFMNITTYTVGQDKEVVKIPHFGTFYPVNLKPRKTPKGMSEARVRIRFKQRRKR